ncbi:MAG: sulfatase-like hydrolase/transferase [Myxococcales bacterium]|nr:sulfatase-like hydrolase/transferase [Myxococcales bacterium]
MSLPDDATAPAPPRVGLARRLLRPTSVGAAYLGLLSLLALGRTLADDQVQGVSARGARQLITSRFPAEVIDAAVLSLASAVALGIFLGVLAGALLMLRDRLLTRKREPASLALPSLGVVVALHIFAWCYDLACHPQAYAAGLYARGGLRAALQIFVCDHLGPTGVVIAAGLSASVFLGGPVLVAVGKQRAARLRAAAAVAGSALVFGLLFSTVGRIGVRPAHAAGARPNVLIIAADSLRADRLDPRVAPELSRLRDKGTSFERAYVGLPRTFPSWVSILSGRDPHHHGVRHMFPRREARAVDVGSIVRQFGSAGYHTAVASDFAGDIFRRYAFGFKRTLTPTFDVRELVRETVLGGQSPILPLLRTRSARHVLPTLRALHETTDARALSADALQAIDDATGKPFFVVAFYSTAHFPYSAPAPHWSRFLDKGYRGRTATENPPPFSPAAFRTPRT